ncbi:MAG: hypothetical protein K9M01_04715 [Candidatus Omnitrophica bacterium]|nr:hypothetical protein [Candidatus Omnitrophota bacterium]
MDIQKIDIFTDEFKNFIGNIDISVYTDKDNFIIYSEDYVLPEHKDCIRQIYENQDYRSLLASNFGLGSSDPMYLRINLVSLEKEDNIYNFGFGNTYYGSHIIPIKNVNQPFIKKDGVILDIDYTKEYLVKYNKDVYIYYNLNNLEEEKTTMALTISAINKKRY